MGMILSGIASYLFGLARFLEIHHLSYFVIVQVFGGIVQTSGWPGVVTVVGNWFGKSKRGMCSIVLQFLLFYILLYFLTHVYVYQALFLECGILTHQWATFLAQHWLVIMLSGTGVCLLSCQASSWESVAS